MPAPPQRSLATRLRLSVPPPAPDRQGPKSLPHKAQRSGLHASTPGWPERNQRNDPVAGRAGGHDLVHLWVTETNDPARRLYEHCALR
jgi:hypothetical protein